MSTEKTVDHLIEVINSRDAKAIANMFTEDAFFAEMMGTGGMAHGRKEIERLWTNFCNDVTHNNKRSTDNWWEIHRKIISGNCAAIQRTSHFVYRGKKLNIDMVAIIEVAGDKIKSYQDYADSRIFIAQEDTETWKAYCDSIKAR